MRILIVGAGIAGPTLAYWLRRAGHEPTLLERSPGVRRGGYLVDFWGAGFDVAERMGLVPRLLTRAYHLRAVREVTAGGRRIAAFDPRRAFGRASERFISIARSDLSSAINEVVEDEVETIFGDTVESLVDDGGRMQVRSARGWEREFDLVIGADGLHSRVRRLAFGPDAEFERPLGIAVGVFDLVGYAPRDEQVAVTHTRVGAQALRIALHDGATMFLFSFRYDGDVPVDDVAAQQELLRSRLNGFGWEVPAALEQLSRARTFYLDRASQIRMPSWTRGRVALVGDAAACPSLLAGQGSALAMVEAYVLAAALRKSNDHRAAFAAYEGRLAAPVRAKQDAALGLGVAFAPRNRTELLLRNGAMGLMRVPLVANLALGRTLRESIELPSWSG